MRNYLVQLNRTRGITIVISSHVLDQLERMCTHYGVIANGRMVRQMTAEQVQHECGESLRVRTADPSRTLALLHQTGQEVLELSMQSRDMEEYFVALMEGGR